MRKRKALVSMFAMAAAVLLVFQNSIVASAAGATYVLRYDEGDEDWEYQVGSAWSETGETRELYYLQLIIKDGDQVVIIGSSSLPALNLNVHLSNLTLTKGASAIVTTKGIDDCYILGNSVSAVNGDIANAYVYDNGAVTFNNNITNLQILGAKDLNAEVTVAGTVGHLVGKDDQGVYYDYYAVQKGRLWIWDGTVKTEEQYYSKTPVAVQSASQPVAGQTASNEYDDVPKTGDSMVCIWLLGTAAVCLAGKYALKRI